MCFTNHKIEKHKRQLYLNDHAKTKSWSASHFSRLLNFQLLHMNGNLPEPHLHKLFYHLVLRKFLGRVTTYRQSIF